MNPWGEDAHTALRWAHRQLDRSGVLPTVLDTYLRASRPPGSLTRLDAHAQAAVIRFVAEGTDPLHRAYLTAYYLPQPTRERSAGGGLTWVDRVYEERAKAVYEVAWWLLGAAGGSGVRRIRGYREIVMQYCLGNQSHRRLRDALRIKSNAVAGVRERTSVALDKLHTTAIAGAQNRLQQRALVP